MRKNPSPPTGLLDFGGIHNEIEALTQRGTEVGTREPEVVSRVSMPEPSHDVVALPASRTRVTWIVLASFCVVIAAHASGLLFGLAYPVITATGVVCATIGLRRHQPQLQWPWWSLVATGALWTISGAVGDLTHSNGDLTSNRSLLPDLFSIPGYVLFGAALIGLTRARRGRSEPGALLDGIMLSTGAMLIVNQIVVAPTLDIKGTWIMARLVVSIYPVMSMCLLALAARLAFAAGDRSVAFRLLLAGTVALLFGDVIFALGEVGTFMAPQALLEVPYLLVPACISSAVLHPSIRFFTRKSERRVGTLGPSRLIAVAAALMAPIIVASTQNPNGKTVSMGLCLVLAVTAILRLASSMREQAALESRLSHQATHDELTGLPSRTAIIDHIDDMLADQAPTNSPVAVMFIDLDQFKLVNDSMGHSMGDQLLGLAARRIASCLRPEDIVGRISGDEFIVLLSLDTIGAYSFGERIRRALSDSFFLDSGEVFITVSVGVTVAYPSDGTVPATLIQEADTAMYRSKESGRNRVTIFDSSMRERVARRVALERRLRRALTERHFEAYFQPLVSLPNGRVNGFEALARWQDDGQMVSPAEFIPVAEESGLIVPLGAFMLDEACRNIAEWRRTIPGGERLYVSVNLSARQIRESDIVDTVAETLERYNLPGHALWLEITESVMMEDSVLTASVMAGLTTLGVNLAIDDFGTGYSSLSYLKRFPVSTVKIDRSFVTGLGQHQADSSLVSAIIAMGSALDLSTIAEGVETPEEAQHLFSLGCRQAQGFLFSKAVSAVDVPAVLQRLGLAQSRQLASSRRCTATPHRS